MDGKITYIFPSRSRPEKFFETLDNISRLSSSENYEVICALDLDDVVMKNKEVQERAKQYKNAKLFYGASANKVAAFNRESANISPDTAIICLLSDDMRFLQKGYDTEIRNAFATHFPNLDGTVHFPDSHAGSRVITMSILGINLFKQLGYLYWPEYTSVFCDNDFTELTKMMGKYVFINKLILDHYHPVWKMAQWDDQYRRTECKKTKARDKEIFLRRKLNNFGL